MEEHCKIIGYQVNDKSLTKEFENYSFLNDILASKFTEKDDVGALYKYLIPDVDKDSLTCSKKIRKEPFDLSTVFSRDSNFDIFIYRMNKVVQSIQEKLKMDWIGIYLVSQSENALVKVAYRGGPSRPFFPLTEEFALGSSNSTVGLTRKIKIIQDVSGQTDGYYECDGRVQSELCIPILDPFNQNLIGIIDAESFTKNFFDEKMILELIAVCKTIAARKINQMDK